MRSQFLWLFIFISSIIQAQSQSSCQEMNVTLTEVNRKFICHLPKLVGACKLRLLRFYFDSNTLKCESFFYEGCAGNRNNFKTKALCECTCNIIQMESTMETKTDV